KVARRLEADEEQIRLGLKAAPAPRQLVGPLMRRWAAGLDNRAADMDRGRIDNHVLRAWARVRVADVNLPRIMAWLDTMGEADEIGAGSGRHCLGLLSRFMSWAVARGFAPRNPCRDLPSGSRPRAVPPPPESIPWIKDDDQAIAVLRALPTPFDAVFFLGNR